MNRRRLLAALGSSFTFIAGCSSNQPTPTQSVNTEATETDTDSRTPTRSPTSSPSPTATPENASFELTDLSAPDRIKRGETANLSVKLTNRGGQAGNTTVYIEIGDLVFKRPVEVGANASKRVRFNLSDSTEIHSFGQFQIVAFELETGDTIRGKTIVLERRFPDTIFVAPHGSSENPGNKDAPLGSIHEAFHLAQPGETIHVQSGVYQERVEPQSGGEPGNPITVTGPPDAILQSNPDQYDVVRIRHSHIHITGMTIDGLENQDAPDDVDSYTPAPLVNVQPPTDTDEYASDIIISPHRIGNSQSALVNIARTENVEVGPFRVIGPAGTRYLLTDRAGHNGEIVYVGTSPHNLGAEWHPWTSYDMTNNVHIHHIDNSDGYAHSEIVNTKLGTHNVTVEYCTDGGGSQNTEDYSSASIRLQSYGATARWCILQNGKGSGVEVASWWADKQQEQKSESELTIEEKRGGTDNSIYGNRVTGFDDKAFVFPASETGQTPEAQSAFCGNVYDGSTDDKPDNPCSDSTPETSKIGHTGGDSPWA